MPSPSSRRRSRSPEGRGEGSSSRRRERDDDRPRHSRDRPSDDHRRRDDRDRDHHRRDDRDRERDRDRDRSDRGDREGSHRSSRRRDDRDDRRGGSGRPDRSPPPPKAITGGDGGWGRRAGSPGRPSLALPSQNAVVGRQPGDEVAVDEAPKHAEPNFKNSGLLAAETNTVNGVVLKYNEPPEAKKPSKSWRLFIFKGKDQIGMLHVSSQSYFLIGRDAAVCDLVLDHPSTSKQHAVLQYRQITERNEFGDVKSSVKPFIIDLESSNGTAVNDNEVPPSRYYELRTGDVLKFADSTKEYVLLLEP